MLDFVFSQCIMELVSIFLILLYTVLSRQLKKTAVMVLRNHPFILRTPLIWICLWMESQRTLVPCLNPRLPFTLVENHLVWQREGTLLPACEEEQLEKRPSPAQRREDRQCLSEGVEGMAEDIEDISIIRVSPYRYCIVLIMLFYWHYIIHHMIQSILLSEWNQAAVIINKVWKSKNKVMVIVWNLKLAAPHCT